MDLLIRQTSTAIAAIALALCSGCGAMSVAGAAVSVASTAVDVGAAVVTTGVKATGSVISAVTTDSK
jgi:hypothetical protein